MAQWSELGDLNTEDPGCTTNGFVLGDPKGKFIANWFASYQLGFLTVLNSFNPKQRFRSEERRVGKKCRSRWSPYH